MINLLPSSFSHSRSLSLLKPFTTQYSSRFFHITRDPLLILFCHYLSSKIKGFHMAFQTHVRVLSFHFYILHTSPSLMHILNGPFLILISFYMLLQIKYTKHYILNPHTNEGIWNLYLGAWVTSLGIIF